MYKSRSRRPHWTRAGLSPSKRMTETQECITWSTHRWIQRGRPRPFRCCYRDIRIFCCTSHLLPLGRPPGVSCGSIVVTYDPWELSPGPGSSRETSEQAVAYLFPCHNLFRLQLATLSASTVLNANRHRHTPRFLTTQVYLHN